MAWDERCISANGVHVCVCEINATFVSTNFPTTHITAIRTKPHTQYTHINLLTNNKQNVEK